MYDKHLTSWFMDIIYKTEVHEKKLKGTNSKLKKIKHNWKSLWKWKQKDYKNKQKQKNKYKIKNKREQIFFLKNTKSNQSEQCNNFLDYKEMPFFYISYFITTQPLPA